MNVCDLYLQIIFAGIAALTLVIGKKHDKKLSWAPLLIKYIHLQLFHISLKLRGVVALLSVVWP